MTLFKKLCNQKNIAFFNQVRSLLFTREVCYNESFRKSTFYINNHLIFFERTFSTRNEIDNANFIEKTDELGDLSCLRDFSNDKDKIIKKDDVNRFRNTLWTRLEIKVLDSLVEKFGENWETVSQYMFDKTPQECKVQFEKMRIQSDSKFTDSPEFTDDDIDQINVLIQKNGRNWRKIAKLFPGKSSLDVERFVNNNPEKFPSLYKDPIFAKRYKGSKGTTWTDDELKSLNELLIKHGRNLNAISEELPNRTPKVIERIISKHILDLPALHSGKVAGWFRSSTVWSESEIRLLNELVETYGLNWEKISEYLPGRSPSSCSTKFYASWSTWNNKVTALVPHKWPKEE
ncbi:transcription factor MYB3R-5-like [Rhizophagus clarus]|uniref:Transcription factor MYB3R-5-like n=1 Tax=Rhizophagus clarus TaxID=94130 RepID=A0A8H3QPP6_9GLOM|nr:transcription factor MYB3R-5-like [Rhizophagus clarus]